MKIACNGTAAIHFEKFRLIFVFGGNSHKKGSLKAIQKYEIDFDKWSIIELQLKYPVHDMTVLQVTKDSVILFGGQSDGAGGPNKEIQVVDLGMECFRAKHGSTYFSLPDSSQGGKSYFPPYYDSKTGKV